MIIYIHDMLDGYVEFYVWESYYSSAEELFVKQFGQRPRASKENAYTVMREIDGWYMDTFEDGCVSFEFDN